jgi:hypothetical protein
MLRPHTGSGPGLKETIAAIWLCDTYLALKLVSDGHPEFQSMSLLFAGFDRDM